MINDFILQFLMQFSAVIVDPAYENSAAIRCYEKAGFERSTYSEDPTHLIMIKKLRYIKEALIWITDLLKKHYIPFLITGGLAASLYGSDRRIADIDIDIPEDMFDVIKNEVQNFITFGPATFKSNRWDLYLMTLNYKGQEIDLSGAYCTKILDEKTGQWQTLPDYLSNSVMMTLFEVELPIIACEDLLAYKKMLAREVDLIDIKKIESRGSEQRHA